MGFTHKHGKIGDGGSYCFSKWFLAKSHTHFQWPNPEFPWPIPLALAASFIHCIHLSFHIFIVSIYTGWWFGTCFIFPNSWDDDPIWLVFFRGVETTNQIISIYNDIYIYIIILYYTILYYIIYIFILYYIYIDYIALHWPHRKILCASSTKNMYQMYQYQKPI